MKKWEAEGKAGNVRSPDDMLQEIARLQQNQVVLLQKQGQASTRFVTSTGKIQCVFTPWTYRIF